MDKEIIRKIIYEAAGLEENMCLPIRVHERIQSAANAINDEFQELIYRCEETELHRDFFRAERDWIRDGEPIDGKKKVSEAWDKYWQYKKGNRARSGLM